MKKENDIKKASMLSKLKTYYSYNKYKIPVLFALIGTILLTAFPGAHYKYWYEVQKGTGDYNALAIFLLMLLSLVQFVNAINISGKKSRKSELVYTVVFTVVNLIMILFAYMYIAPYFKNGFNVKYLNSILIIVIGIGFMILSNVFSFKYLGYDTNASVKEILATLDNDVESLIVTDEE